MPRSKADTKNQLYVLLITRSMVSATHIFDTSDGIANIRKGDSTDEKRNAEFSPNVPLLEEHLERIYLRATRETQPTTLNRQT